MIPTFLVTILTLSTLTTFTAMSSNVDKVEAQTVVDPDCQPNSPSTVDCDVTIDYDGNCTPNGNPPNAADCNIDITVDATPPPDGNNELKLDYILNTGIFCSNVQSSYRAACLLNTQNDYDSDIDVTREPGTTSDNQFNFQGSQQIRETAGQDNFRALNDMTQNVRVNTEDTGSVIDTDGDGDNFQLQYLQDIVEPDDTKNTNNAHQLVTLEALNGGIIDTSEHSELGFRVEQRLIDIDDTDLATSSNPSITVSAENRANQVLGADSTNGAEINYDTNGLSLVSQTIDDCSFGTANCLNSAGTPGDTSLTNGQRVQLFADGAGDVAIVGNDEIEGTNVDVDNLRQLLNQNIDNFENAPTPTRDATNRVDGQLFFANAKSGGDIDMALSDVTEQTQSISQSITDSNRNTLNKVVPIATGPNRTPVGQGIFIGDDPRTTDDPRIGAEAVLGLVEADVDQELTQSISGATTGVATTSSSNTGTMTITLLAKEGPSELFVEGFNQYLRQTASNCSNCHNNGQVHATFEVTDAATFTLEEGSTQGLTQTVTQNGKTNTNAVISTIRVAGDGTEANIGLEQELTATNGNRQGNPDSIFTASYGTGTGAGQTFNQQCNINSFGTFTQVNNAGPCS